MTSLTRFRLLPILVAALALSAPLRLFATDPVELRLEPEASANAIETIDLNDERLAPAEPVLDPKKRADGWKWVDFESKFRGFVMLESVGKDLSVAPGTLVYLRPSETSPVLTTITEDDAVDLVWASDWAEIQLTKAIPVYFKTDPQPLPEIIFDRGYDSDPPTGSAPGIFESAKSDPDAPPASGLYRFLDGILTTTHGQLGKDGKYALQLVDKKGKRLAYVDSSKIRVPNSIAQYLNRSVTVYGAVTTTKKSGTLVIDAKTIRPKM